jgi:hypothetical protein
LAGDVGGEIEVVAIIQPILAVLKDSQQSTNNTHLTNSLNIFFGRKYKIDSRNIWNWLTIGVEQPGHGSDD